MLNAMIIAALAASPAAPVPYADCLLGNIQPGLSDHAVQLVQQACAAKHPDSFIASLELERNYSAQRQARFDAERAAWQASGEFDRVSDLLEGGAGGGDVAAIEVPDGADVIEAPFGGSVWKLLVAPGDTVKEGDVIAVIEAMKMECPFESPASGTVEAIYIAEGHSLQPGAPMLALRPSA